MQNSQTEVKSFSFENSEIRIILEKQESYFVVSDACRALDLKDPSTAIRNLDEDEYHLRTIGGADQGRPMLVVSESGLYHLIFKSRKPEARRFRKWVTSEVLPALRKTGYYGVPAYQHSSGQLSMFPVQSDSMLELQQLAMDVALSAKPGSRVAQFVRKVKPYLFTSKSMQL